MSNSLDLKQCINISVNLWGFVVKKSLKQQLDFSILCVVGVSIVFCIIGAILKSDGCKPDPEKIYEIGKDTLSFCVALLAPVIAYVLFNDWRREHIEKKIEADSESIFKDIHNIYTKLFEVRMSICTKETLEEKGALQTNMLMDLLTIDLLRVKNNVKLLKSENKTVEKFINESNVIIESLNSVNNKYYGIQDNFCTSAHIKKEYDYLSQLNLATEELRNNTDRINSLNDTCKDLQVKSF